MSADLQNKLFHYEESPPEGLWSALSAALDDGFSPTLASKLQQFEAPPPPAAWQKITAALSAPAPEQAPVVPFFRRYRRPLKYTGAVAFFVICAMVVSLTISKKTISETTAAGPMKTNAVPASGRPQTRGSIDSRQPEPIALEALNARKQAGEPLVNETYGAERRARRASAFTFASFIPHAPHAAVPIADGRMDQYLVYTDEQGNAVRVPKKLFDAIACPVNTVDCREKLRRLQRRMAAAAMNPGFNGVLDLANHLNENP